MKKGFTLVEMMMTMIIIATIALIVTPLTIKMTRDAKQKLYDTQINNIKSAARAYMVDIHLEEQEQKVLTLDMLAKSGKLEKDIKNPKTGELFCENIYVLVKCENGIYKYKVTDGCVY